MKGYSPLRLLACTAAAAIALTAFSTSACAAVTGLPRERGAIYLEDFLRQPYRLKVLSGGPIYFNMDQARFLGTLRAGQVVEVQAISDNGASCRVRGLAMQGQVVGWIDSRFLTAIDPQFLDGLHRNVARRERVKALVAANEVALGMTPNEVTASLGNPPKRASRTDSNGVTERWDYIRYEQVPKQVVGVDVFGRAFTNVIYEKVPVGSFTVVFANDAVSAIEQSEGTLATAATQVKIVPPPIALAN